MRRRALILVGILVGVTAAHAEPAADREIGVRLGLRTGFAGATPGGLRIAAPVLYRLTDDIWSDSEGAISFGANSAECYLTRAEEVTLTCAHGSLDGFSFGAVTGLRYFFDFSPVFVYARGAIGLEVGNFAADDVTGVAIPITGGIGARRRVDPVTIAIELNFFFGPAFYDSLGAEPYLGFILQAGTDFGLP